MKNVLITADDFGMCDWVDRAILDLAQVGMITTTNVITNMESLENGRLLRDAFPNVSVGIHWNVTTGLPVSPSFEIPSLLDETGRFHSGDRFWRYMSDGKINMEEMEKELLHQYEVFREICGEAAYWNVHENVVLHRKAYRVFADTAKKLNITKTRTFQRVYLDRELLKGKRRVREMMVRRYMDLWYGAFVRREFAMPDGRVIVFREESKLDYNKLINALEMSPKQCIELVFHPSIGADHPLFGDMKEQRVKEYLFLKDPDTIETFHKKVHLIGFGEIEERRSNHEAV